MLEVENIHRVEIPADRPIEITDRLQGNNLLKGAYEDSLKSETMAEISRDRRTILEGLSSYFDFRHKHNGKINDREEAIICVNGPRGKGYITTVVGRDLEGDGYYGYYIGTRKADPNEMNERLFLRHDGEVVLHLDNHSNTDIQVTPELMREYREVWDLFLESKNTPLR